MARQLVRNGETLNSGGFNIEITGGGGGDGVALTAAQLASLVAADSALQPTDLLPTGDGEIVTINGRALPSGGGGGITMQQVNDAIDAIRTSAELLTFPTAGTFTGGGMGGGDTDHQFIQQRLDSLGLDNLFLPAPSTPDTTARATGLKQFEKVFAGFTNRIYYFGRIPTGDSRTITGDGFVNDVDSFFEAGTDANSLIFIRQFIG